MLEPPEAFPLTRTALCPVHVIFPRGFAHVKGAAKPRGQAAWWAQAQQLSQLLPVRAQRASTCEQHWHRPLCARIIYPLNPVPLKPNYVAALSAAQRLQPSASCTCVGLALRVGCLCISNWAAKLGIAVGLADVEFHLSSYATGTRLVELGV